MKLRIQENLLRLRLTQKEVACLHHHRLVECAIRFPSGPNSSEVSVDYKDNSISVALPGAAVTAWAESGRVSVEGFHLGVRILVEKDFQCLHKPGEQDPDAYPHPLAPVKKRPVA